MLYLAFTPLLNFDPALLLLRLFILTRLLTLLAALLFRQGSCLIDDLADESPLCDWAPLFVPLLSPAAETSTVSIKSIFGAVLLCMAGFKSSTIGLALFFLLSVVAGCCGDEFSLVSALIFSYVLLVELIILLDSPFWPLRVFVRVVVFFMWALYRLLIFPICLMLRGMAA